MATIITIVTRFTAQSLGSRVRVLAALPLVFAIAIVAGLVRPLPGNKTSRACGDEARGSSSAFGHGSVVSPDSTSSLAFAGCRDESRRDALRTAGADQGRDSNGGRF